MSIKRKILVAVDDSDQARDAFVEAVTIAKAKEANLYLVSVIDEDILSNREESDYSHSLVGQRQELLNNYRQLAKDQFDFDQVNAEVFVGEPKRQIIHLLKEDPAFELIVVGATGKNARERLFMGSVSQFVVRHSPVSVLIVR
ncbi:MULTISPECIES: universal stress protein [Aerococcus]|uniref:universal stress protein n=1 Tax=Aerococcus TaxID=1375 RepID=UPI0018A7BBFC|nr:MULTISPECIES: universal stress protein [Aerococcus]MCY3035910.1 universal stress protein [Aerococcus sp. Group 2]MCY3039006.1 universal stress protein [Aerococcus sp. Group 2]MCY3040577.1 universal stress protein [Aerococcus sp. Group 2]MCY3042574.1 universal stress protein [Aerococcus sp. Group 2]MDK6520022.1 universal stress protein [Aerococcus urinae]